VSLFSVKSCVLSKDTVSTVKRTNRIKGNGGGKRTHEKWLVKKDVKENDISRGQF